MTIRRWEDNIKTYIRETGYDVDWIHVDQYRAQYRGLMATVMNVGIS
jgi:hypothetical protein